MSWQALRERRRRHLLLPCLIVVLSISTGIVGILVWSLKGASETAVQQEARKTVMTLLTGGPWLNLNERDITIESLQITKRGTERDFSAQISIRRKPFLPSQFTSMGRINPTGLTKYEIEGSMLLSQSPNPVIPLVSRKQWMNYSRSISSEENVLLLDNPATWPQPGPGDANLLFEALLDAEMVSIDRAAVAVFAVRVLRGEGRWEEARAVLNTLPHMTEGVSDLIQPIAEEERRLVSKHFLKR